MRTWPFPTSADPAAAPHPSALLPFHTSCVKWPISLKLGELSVQGRDVKRYWLTSSYQALVALSHSALVPSAA